MKAKIQTRIAFTTLLIYFCSNTSLVLGQNQVNTDFFKNYKFSSTKVIQSKNGYQLTEGDLEWSRFLVEFLLGSPLDAADKKFLADDTVNEFKKNPAGLKAGTNDAMAIMNQINQLPDGQKVGYLRSVIVGKLYPNRKKAEMKQIFAWFDKYNPILHYDLLNSMVLTRADLIAYQHMYSLLYKLQNARDFVITPAQMEQNVKILINNYRLGNNETKLEIASMQYSYIQTVMAYERINNNQKQQLAQQYRQNNSSSGAVAEAYGNQQQAHQLMSRIIQMGNISRHNMIESIGGGDKTYYSLDYNSPLAW